MGTQSLSLEDIQPALEQLKKKLMERNVAEEIAAKYVGSISMIATLHPAEHLQDSQSLALGYLVVRSASVEITGLS